MTQPKVVAQQQSPQQPPTKEEQCAEERDDCLSAANSGAVRNGVLLVGLTVATGGIGGLILGGIGAFANGWNLGAERDKCKNAYDKCVKE